MVCLLVVLDCTLVYQCPCSVEWFVVGVGNKAGLAHRIVKDVWLVSDCPLKVVTVGCGCCLLHEVCLFWRHQSLCWCQWFWYF